MTPVTASTRSASDRGVAVLLLIGGLVGFTAAFVLTLEKITLLSDAGSALSCDLNPILSCGSIMKTEQAEAFGFPNPLIGVAAFPVLAATGAAVLAGARFARWYWLGLQLGVTLGIAFIGWLIFQSLYRIGALCPYCMVVWAVVLPVFWHVTVRNASAGVFGARIAGSRITRWAREWSVLVITVAVLLVIALITEQFWYYWRTLV
ncbi:putative Membrane protein [Nocardioidaceae bacterium Broad-1]|nr:putative Membrane protein [Nocardioidaceae bacterium Broad-1]